jgi:hypothetical protein
MPINEPNFAVGDRVCELWLRIDTDGQRIKGTITEVYQFGDEDRYVVLFDDGTDGVFFDFEIMPA